MAKLNRQQSRKRRHRRVRAKISGSAERPRLCVYRSSANIYAQVINDDEGNTIVSASSIDKELVADLTGKTKSEAAKIVGEQVAKRATEAGITTVVFDRGGYRYHGRIKALADGARDGGLKF